MADTDSGGLAGLLGWFGRPYDPQAAYEGLLSSQGTKDALQARSLASVAQAFGAGAGSDARGSAIPFGTTMGNAAAAAYGGQDALIKARLEDAQQQQAVAGAQFTIQRAGAMKDLLPIMKLAMGVDPSEIEKGEKPSPLSPAALIASQQAAGGGNVSGGGDANSANYNFAGMRAPGTSGGGPVTNPAGWQKFDTPEAGLAAIGNQVDRYASGKTTGKPLTTLNQIVSTWAPPSENDTALLLSRAVKNTGFGPNDPLDLSNPTTKAKVVEALIRNEHGDRVPAAVTPELMTKVFNTPTPHVFAGSGGAPQTAGVSAVPPAAPGSTALPLPDPSAGPRGLLDLAPVPSHAGALDEGAPPRAPVPGQGAALAPQGLPPSLLAQQPDPVTAQTVNAIAAAGPGRGAPGVNAAPAGAGVGGLLNGGAMAGAPPPVDPRLAALAQRVAGPGAPSEPAAPAGPPSLLAPGGSLQRTIDQTAGATVRPMPPPDSMPGQRLALPPSLLQQPPAAATPAAPPPAAMPAPAQAPPPAGAPAPVAGTPTARQIAASRYLTAVMPMLGLGAAPEWAQQNAAFPLVGPTEAAKKQAGVGPQMQIDAAQQFQQMQREIILQQLKTSTETVEVPVADANGRYVGKTVMTRDKAAEYLNRSGQGAAGGPAAPGARLPPVEPYVSPEQQAERQGIGKTTAEDYDAVFKAHVASQQAKPFLLTIQQALQTFDNPGAGAPLKLEATKALAGGLATLGIKPSENLQKWIDAGEMVNVSGARLGIEMAKTLGTGHANAGIIRTAINNNPNLAMSLGGNQQLLALLGSIIDRNAAKLDFYQEYKDDPTRGKGSYEGASRAFDKVNPWEVTVSQFAPYQVGPGKMSKEAYAALPPGVKVQQTLPDGTINEWTKGQGGR